VQAQLHADEALVLFLDTGNIKPTPEETFIWVVTKTNVRWVRSSLGVTALTREVLALRCGLDLTAAMEPNCAKLTGKAYTEEDAQHGKPLFFDHVRAHKLYAALFGQIEDAIKDKHLLIVPSGPLTQLPFQVLVTAPPTGRDHKSAAWLVRKHAVTILPAVSSLQALRRLAHASGAKKQMIGFGNPLLDGNTSDARYAKYYQARAQLARDNQQCQRTPSRQVVAAVVARRGITLPQSLANLSHIRMQDPLPETAFELCAVARALNADEADLRLGASASEHEIKTLNASGQLANYRIVHFATHGALAGELRGTTEPGLILTPPETPSEDDDGYLSASEIAELKLDADWVILSACNTAAGDAVGAQALSGLARAFIYAQARALLVSHWAVDSNATVKLITTAMRAMANNPRMGRAEALRRAMLSLIDKGDPREAHPAHWAPFIVVGEGAR
jgi:CHAT domain-containing protein